MYFLLPSKRYCCVVDKSYCHGTKTLPNRNFIRVLEKAHWQMVLGWSKASRHYFE
jgi:hypothetical protein